MFEADYADDALVATGLRTSNGFPVERERVAKQSKSVETNDHLESEPKSGLKCPCKFTFDLEDETVQGSDIYCRPSTISVSSCFVVEHGAFIFF